MTRTNKNAGSRAGVREDMQQLLLSDGHMCSKNDEARSVAGLCLSKMFQNQRSQDV